MHDKLFRYRITVYIPHLFGLTTLWGVSIDSNWIFFCSDDVDFNIFGYSQFIKLLEFTNVYNTNLMKRANLCIANLLYPQPRFVYQNITLQIYSFTHIAKSACDSARVFRVDLKTWPASKTKSSRNEIVSKNTAKVDDNNNNSSSNQNRSLHHRYTHIHNCAKQKLCERNAHYVFTILYYSARFFSMSLS